MHVSAPRRRTSETPATSRHLATPATAGASSSPARPTPNVSFPGSAAWDRERTEREKTYLMEKVNRGEWTPPRGGQGRIRFARGAAVR